jgi:hypothetical protein
MKRLMTALIAIALLAPLLAAQQKENYDYWRFNRDLIRYGQQALFMCNGLFTSERTIEHVFAQELAFLPSPVGTPRGGDYVIDRDRKAVAVGVPGGIPVMRAAFRKGIGCVILAPDQTFEDINRLPSLEMPPPPGDAASIPWPDGDRNAQGPLPAEVDGRALQAASDWAFDRETPEQIT